MIKLLAIAAVRVGWHLPSCSRRVRKKSAWRRRSSRGVGVTVGSGHGDCYRDREVIRDREYRHPDRDETVVIKRDRDYDPDRRVIIECERYASNFIYVAISSTKTASRCGRSFFFNNAAGVR